MSRRWTTGEAVKAGGIELRPMPGNRSHDDLRLDWCIGGQWQTVDLATVLALVDFFYENEEVIHPRPMFKGGDYFLGYVRHAARHGWRKAMAGLGPNRTDRQEAMF